MERGPIRYVLKLSSFVRPLLSLPCAATGVAPTAVVPQAAECQQDEYDEQDGSRIMAPYSGSQRDAMHAVASPDVL
jgi:hypothetical protein